MKFGPRNEHEKRRKKRLSKKSLMMTLSRQIMKSLSFSDLWQIWSNSESGFQIHVP